jgi:SnoaL-like domain
MTDALDGLLAKQAITEVLYRYCRGLDRMDRALCDTVWHPGGTGDYGAIFSGTGAEFLDWVWPVHAAMRRHSHQITNVLVEVDGDRAISEAYVTVCLRNEAEPGRLVDIVSRGRYVDRWARRDGRWAIEHRRYVDDITNVHDVPESPMTDGTHTGAARDRTDPSYELFS